MTMRSPIAPKRIGSIESISYYTDTQILNDANLASDGDIPELTFFHGHLSTDENENDLGKPGQLPQSASAWLRQVMVTPFSLERSSAGTAGTTGATRQNQAFRWLESVGYFYKAEIYIADILVARGPICAYGGPGPIVQGVSDLSGVSGAGLVTNAMSGLPMMDHPVHSRNTIRVRVSQRSSLPSECRPHTDSVGNGKFGMHVTIGVAQATAIAGSRD
jgi:hypothetical protein